MKCKVCFHVTYHQPCSDCRRKLPPPTFDALQNGRITAERAVQILIERRTSVKKLRGGTHSPDRT